MIAALVGFLVCPVPAAAQQSAPARIPRIGILTPAATDQTPIFAAFRRGLNEFGYTEGRNVILEFRGGQRPRGRWLGGQLGSADGLYGGVGFWFLSAAQLGSDRGHGARSIRSSIRILVARL